MGHSVCGLSDFALSQPQVSFLLQWFSLPVLGAGTWFSFSCSISLFRASLSPLSRSICLSLLLVFSFCFVDFLVFFWLIFKCFCFVLIYKSISYFTIFSLANLLCPFLSCFAGLSLSGPLLIVFTVVVQSLVFFAFKELH